ncbi:hypothetical protein L6164_015247 [Bauhinia variegata]|uniref:Uncharacterized protein n=1 Tax=Bauhinia variegata TaxID=167791 RepID=A0ACB9NL98_BAUVA|nr:hypothetical protein L6164_015247 [Bauhinia variegata]
MSRCFPFLPPGYMRNGARSEALIESIKPQRDREKADKERKKEKKREKKERRKEGKVKDGRATHPSDDKEKESKISKLEYPRLVKRRAEGSIGGLQKRDDDDNEQLERSGISEEHDQPVSSRELGCLSDSTQTSKKRNRNSSLYSHDHGNVIRIRLPLYKELEASQHDDQLVSTSGSVGRMGTIDSFTQETNGSLPQRRNFTDAEAYQCMQDNESERLTQESASTFSGGKSLKNGSQSVVSVYNSIFQNWLPPPIKFEGSNFEDVDWLFPSELQGRSKQLKSSANGRCCSSPSLLPGAQCLPEVEIYALPYAIPF